MSTQDWMTCLCLSCKPETLGQLELTVSHLSIQPPSQVTKWPWASGSQSYLFSSSSHSCKSETSWITCLVALSMCVIETWGWTMTSLCRLTTWALMRLASAITTKQGNFSKGKSTAQAESHIAWKRRSSARSKGWRKICQNRACSWMSRMQRFLPQIKAYGSNDDR